MIATISRTRPKARFILTFSHRHAIHRTVLVTLAAWVLVLMAGIAKACVLHDSVPGHGGQVQVIVPDAPEAECDAAWEAGAFTIAKQEGRDGTSLGPAALQTVGVGSNTVSAALIAQSVDTGVVARGLPGAIRFLRLRL